MEKYQKIETIEAMPNTNLEHKLAYPINLGVYNVTIALEEPGYTVFSEYRQPYWLPKDVFEATYVKVD